MTQADIAALNSRLAALEATAQAQSQTLAQILQLLTADGADDGPTPIVLLTQAVVQLDKSVDLMRTEIVSAIATKTGDAIGGEEQGPVVTR
jgi:septal ring factor EnvC (AmiA/AmiB activator)